jgi:hypothetical protein
MHRPVGVTVISIVAILGGLAQLAYAGLPAAIGLIGLGMGAGIGTLVGVLALLVAVALGIGAVAQIAFGIAAMRLSGWAWTMGVLVSGFNAILNVVAMLSNNGVGNYIGLFLSGIVLFYLTTPDVKKAFGK